MNMPMIRRLAFVLAILAGFAIPATATAQTTAPSIAFYGDSLTGDYYWHGYLRNGLPADLTANGYTYTPIVTGQYASASLKGCGGEKLAQFVGRIAPTGAPADLACKQQNTLTAHASTITSATVVVVAFITNDWDQSSAAFRGDVHTAVSRIKALHPTVRRIVFVKNYMATNHNADLVAQATIEGPVVRVLDVSAAFGGNYSTCANPLNQRHPTDACWKRIATNLAGQLGKV